VLPSTTAAAQDITKNVTASCTNGRHSESMRTCVGRPVACDALLRALARGDQPGDTARAVSYAR
jgi:hypothetical protein